MTNDEGSARRTVTGFRQAYGYEPDGLWSAPGRVNLVGEHTDYNEGFVLPFAIHQRTWVAVGRRTDRISRVGSANATAVVEQALDGIDPGSLSGWSAYPLGTAGAIIDIAVDDPREVCGFDAYFTSDVAVGAGLSSSAALECSLALALSDVWCLDLDGEELLRSTHLAENHYVGAPTGILDQSASLFSRESHALFVDCRDTCMEVIPLDLTAAGLTMLVCDTTVTHAHAGGGYAERRASCEEAAELLGVPALRDVSMATLADAGARMDDVTYRRARHVISENERVLETIAVLRSDGPRGIGGLLVESHGSMRDDFEISVPELDVAVDVALAAGAIGARMTGGGFGGSAIVLVDTDGVPQVQHAIEAEFAGRGFARPTIFQVSPSQGARRERIPGPVAGGRQA
jgi:galactokinase